MSEQYECPKCFTTHADTAWTKATEDDMGGPVMPLEVADDADYMYTCPGCWDVVENKDLRILQV